MTKTKFFWCFQLGFMHTFADSFLHTCADLLLLNIPALISKEFLTNPIHHSNRGVYYCSYDYVYFVKENRITISMTESGEGYDNQIAERVNGILKTEFNLHQMYKSRTEAMLAVKQSIKAYDNFRPHMSCGFLTSVEAHATNQILVKRWKNSRKRMVKNKEQTAFYQHQELVQSIDLMSYVV